MKKALTLLIATIMLFTIVPVAMGGFEDSPKPDHWVYDQYQLVYNSGLLKGYPDGTFKGERYATRYEMVELTARVLRLIEGKLAGIDVDPTVQTVGLSESQVKDIIADVLAENDYATYAELTDDYFALQEIMDNKDERLAESFQAEVDELYNAVKALEEEFRSELFDLDIRVSLLETEIELLKFDVADLQDTVGGMDENVETAAQNAKSAKTLGIIGIILGIAGVALGVM